MQKAIRALVFGVMVATSGVALANPTQEFESRAQTLQQQVDQGTKSELDMAKDLAELAKSLFPTDYRFQSLRNYKVFLASQLERGEIKRDEFDYLWSEKRLQFLAARDQANQQQAQAFQRQQADEQAANDRAVGHALGSIGRSITNAARPPGVNCVSVPVGASVSTNCQ